MKNAQLAGPRWSRRSRFLGFQVVLGVGGLLSLVAASILISIYFLTSIKEDSARLSHRDVPYASAVAEAALNAKGIANDERGFLMSGNPKFADEAGRRIVVARAAFGAAARAAAGSPQHQAIAGAHSAFERWVRGVRSEFSAFRLGERQRSVAAALGPNRALRKSYERLLDTAQALGATAIESAETSVAKASSRSTTILIAWFCGALAIGLGVVLWLLRAITRPMRNLMAILATGEQVRINA
jgi:methyl-accepting chemotaxis protein